MLGIEDLDQIAARGFKNTAVAHLAAGFTVERGLGRYYIDLISCACLCLALAFRIDPEHTRIRVEAIVTDKLNRVVQLQPDFGLGNLSRFARPGSLPFHLLLKARAVNFDALRAQNVLR